MIQQGFALPGEFIGTNEEFIKGEQTFNKGGNIYSAVTGYIKVGKTSRIITVEPKSNPLSYIQTGDIIIGQVTAIKNSVALVEIAHIKGKGEREIINLEPAAIHVSNIKNTYVKDISKELHPFDIVKARVLDAKSMRLTTADRELGVMKAYCSKCRQPLRKNAFGLTCESCGNKETRKISKDYGTGII
jgi:exosome complex component CSL4